MGKALYSEYAAAQSAVDTLYRATLGTTFSWRDVRVGTIMAAD